VYADRAGRKAALTFDNDEILALAAEHGLGFFRVAPLVLRGRCLAALGRAEEGIPLLTAASAFIHECGFIAITPWCLLLFADACRMAGQLQLAYGHLAEALRVGSEAKARWMQAETLRVRGDVLLAMGDPAAAEAGYREAIALAQRQSATLWELRAAMSLARLRRDQGKRTDARDLLAPVYGWFTEGFGAKRRGCSGRRARNRRRGSTTGAKGSPRYARRYRARS
jgi:predicted ATPase